MQGSTRRCDPDQSGSAEPDRGNEEGTGTRPHLRSLNEQGRRLNADYPQIQPGDGFKGYKATLFVGEKSYTEINIPLRGGDDLFLHGNKDAGCIGYFSGSEVLLFGSYGLFARDDDSRYLLTKERR